MNKEIRWQERFQNLERAFIFLQEGLRKESLDPYQEAGIIQSFEFTFELSWKTLKDFLESKGMPVSFARDVIKEAFATGLIQDGHLWIDMLEKRNLLSHTYNRAQATQAVNLIRERYLPGLEQVYLELKQRCSAS
ncbi:MAG: nucleotidyltransferase substrate binding protein [Verrucomicrobiota bacterium]|nr:nucleotidyltransferase substrate binding protein [Verrucomicrobiota bacterium]